MYGPSDAWDRVGLLTGYPTSPADLGAASRIQVSLLAFPFIGPALTHLIAAFNWAVWMETRRFFKTLGYPPDHESAVARIATTTVTAWLACAKLEWRNPGCAIGESRFTVAPPPSHTTSAFGSAGSRSPEQQENCVAYTQLLLSRIPPSALIAFTDGSAIPNPGPCGAGFSVWRDGVALAEGSYPLGEGTNNIGELCAIGISVRHILDSPALLADSSALYILSDSLLIVQGLSGAAWIKRLDDEIQLVRGLLDSLADVVPVRVLWIPGHVKTAGNDRADERAKEGAIASTGLPASYLHLIDISFNFPLPPLLPPPAVEPEPSGPWATLPSPTPTYMYPPFPLNLVAPL